MSDAHRRLADLLAGWMLYVQKCAGSEQPHPGVTKAQYEAEAAQLHELYQWVGSRDSMTDHDVDAYAKTVIVTMLRLGPTPTGSKE